MTTKILHLKSIIVLVICLLLNISSFASTKRRIAVLDFINTSRRDDQNYLIKTIPESISTYLVKSEEIEIVERTRLMDAVEEMKLGLTGLLDETTASKLGKAVGADSIIIGSFVEIREQLRINARIIDVKTAKAITSEQVTGNILEII